ncbi:hypothetical protein N7532_009929 [Penicillium argentinense]|uniref:Uncharacterized protein n=1 Tax=Penicillium argentinense TaxID=1131581 RepID=A0A9W9ENL4_9EURO|nr:uncharacterized protein N7532_009929 [Penicillium argentinense]KAJ5085158.1 hypothetical protein N7532_009929 [Penicillium argentinense]
MYIDQNGEEQKILRLVGSEGITILAKTGYLPTVKTSEGDESAGSVSDLVVVARLVEGVSITPLETHTTIHVGCTIILYTIWFHKPYNLTQFIEVSGPDVESIGAIFNFYSISQS